MLLLTAMCQHTEKLVFTFIVFGLFSTYSTPCVYFYLISCFYLFSGHTRPVHIPDCVVFNVTLNACRGFCESYAIPSPSRTLKVNDNHIITSRAECCSIRETHDVSRIVDISFTDLLVLLQFWIYLS